MSQLRGISLRHFTDRALRQRPATKLRKACLKEEVHADLEFNIEEEICDGVPGKDGVDFDCLVMITPKPDERQYQRKPGL